MLVSFSLLGLFLTVDLTFFFANSRKIEHGGWIPLIVGLGIFGLMTTWKTGKRALSKALLEGASPLEQFIDETIRKKRPPRIRGTAVFMTLNLDIAPPVLLHHFKHNQVLHEQVILLTITNTNTPDVDPRTRLTVKPLSHGFYKVIARYGYMETPDISEILIFCLAAGLPIDPNQVSFYLGRETIYTTGPYPMRQWRKRLFAFLSRNARPATDYFGLPGNQVIEIGSQVDI